MFTNLECIDCLIEFERFYVKFRVEVKFWRLMFVCVSERENEKEKEQEKEKERERREEERAWRRDLYDVECDITTEADWECVLE